MQEGKEKSPTSLIRQLGLFDSTTSWSASLSVPVVFILASLGIPINTLNEKPVEAIAGLGFTALGIPVYY